MSGQVSKHTAVGVTAALCLALMGCGADPTGPSVASLPGSPSTALQGKPGTVTGLAGGAGQAVATRSQEEAAIVVSVLEVPSVTTTVGPDGWFVLRGLPTTDFTLVFTRESVELGRLTLAGLLANQEIHLRVEVVDDGVELVEERRIGIGHGDVEVEGDVELVLQLDPTGDSLFQIYSHVVLAQPGVTTIRQGDEARGVEDVMEGLRAHVKGIWLPPADQTSQQVVLAHEIILQEETGDGSGTAGTITICHIPPGNSSASHTLQIDESAWPAHAAHGDTLGPCSS